MEDGRMPKDLLYGELSGGSRPQGRSRLRFKDSSKRDMKCGGVKMQSWESFAKSRDSWRAAVQSGTKQAEQNYTACMKRVARKSSSTDQMVTIHTCSFCGKNCHSRI
jgi:hypothetical protein